MARLGMLLLVALSSLGCASHSSKPGTDQPAADGGEPSAPVPAANACVSAGTCPPGTWTDVTPTGVDLQHMLGCGNYGTQSMQADPDHPGHFYTLFMCQGVWKTTDYGSTWTGPINTGEGGAMVGDCAGGITIAPHADTTTLYVACIRGAGLGFWRSENAGVDWVHERVAPGADRQDFYPPVVDPYDARHLLMAGHEMNVLVESHDAGRSWTEVATDAGMKQQGGTASVFFVDVGDASRTAKTFLWIAQQSDMFGTWRTENAGSSWAKVDKNEHPHGLSQIYQPDAKGVVYMAGAYSALGWGVLRSADYGKTWMHVGAMGNEAVVFGTKRAVFAMSSGAIGLGGMADPSFQTAPQPGTDMWTMPGTPAQMKIGAAQAAVVNDGMHDVILTANWGAGVWRYVSP